MAKTEGNGRANGHGGQRDFISDFLAMTEAARSPWIFRLWSGIALVAGALERRVWARVGSQKTFGNLYTFLVAPPGAGKYIIEEVHELWHAARESGSKGPAFHVAPRSMTKASMIDELVKTKQVRVTPEGPAVEYSTLLIAAEEVGVLMPAYDTEYLGVLNSIYNNPTIPYTETRRTGSVREVVIPFPQINLLAGVQPGWMQDKFPEEAWSTGLTSRLIMVYADDVPLVSLLAETEGEEEMRQDLLRQLTLLSFRYGEVPWAPGVLESLDQWYLADCPPKPTHSKLENYCRRRGLHTIKLCLASAASRQGLRIEEFDLERAKTWLLGAEKLMPDIFRAMVGRSDQQVVEELHYMLSGLFAAGGNAPIPGSKVVNFLRQRVPSEKVDRILDVAERSGVLARVAGQDAYLPRAKEGWVE